MRAYECAALQREILEFATRSSSLWNTQEASGAAVQSKEFFGYVPRVVRFPGERAIGECNSNSGIDKRHKIFAIYAGCTTDVVLFVNDLFMQFEKDIFLNKNLIRSISNVIKMLNFLFKISRKFSDFVV